MLASNRDANRDAIRYQRDPHRHLPAGRLAHPHRYHWLPAHRYEYPTATYRHTLCAHRHAATTYRDACTPDRYRGDTPYRDLSSAGGNYSSSTISLSVNR